MTTSCRQQIYLIELLVIVEIENTSLFVEKRKIFLKHAEKKRQIFFVVVIVHYTEIYVICENYKFCLYIIIAFVFSIASVLGFRNEKQV